MQMYNKSKQQSLHDALGSSKYVTHKRLRIDIGALKEIIYNTEIESISWIKSTQQITDSLIKLTKNNDQGLEVSLHQ